MSPLAFAFRLKEKDDALSLRISLTPSLLVPLCNFLREERPERTAHVGNFFGLKFATASFSA
jgi:hypothetical protein